MYFDWNDDSRLIWVSLLQSGISFQCKMAIFNCINNNKFRTIGSWIQFSCTQNRRRCKCKHESKVAFHCNFEAFGLYIYRWIASCGNAMVHYSSEEMQTMLHTNNTMITDKNNSDLKYDMNFYYDAFGRRWIKPNKFRPKIYVEKVRIGERCIDWKWPGREYSVIVLKWLGWHHCLEWLSVGWAEESGPNKDKTD